jgi:hypothetical protein
MSSRVTGFGNTSFLLCVFLGRGRGGADDPRVLAALPPDESRAYRARCFSPRLQSWRTVFGDSIYRIQRALRGSASTGFPGSPVVRKKPTMNVARRRSRGP